MNADYCDACRKMTIDGFNRQTDADYILDGSEQICRCRYIRVSKKTAAERHSAEQQIVSRIEALESENTSLRTHLERVTKERDAYRNASRTTRGDS